MTFGSAIHAAMPASYAGDYSGALAAFRQVWRDNDKWADKKRTENTGRRIIAAMCEVHSTQEYRPVRPEVLTPGEGEHETTFEVSLGLPSCKSVTGRIDCLVERTSDHSRWLREYKTASQIWGSFPDIFTRNAQIETYALAMKLLGVPVAGALVEGILVAAGKTDCVPVPVEISEDKLEEILEWWRWQDGMLSAHESLSDLQSSPIQAVRSWPKNLAACTPYPQFGSQGFVCDYQPLCLAGDRWPGLLGQFSQAKRDEVEQKGGAE
jgi:hypothetical protein